MTRTHSILMGLALAGIAAYAATAQDYARPPAGVTGAVSGAGVAEICQRGYSATVRPPEWVSEAYKRSILPAGHRLSEFQLDHLIPLCLGGAPTDTRNIWLQPQQEAKIKDRLEARLCHMACAGQVPLSVAQHAIATDWVTAYQEYMK